MIFSRRDRQEFNTVRVSLTGKAVLFACVLLLLAAIGAASRISYFDVYQYVRIPIYVYARWKSSLGLVHIAASVALMAWCIFALGWALARLRTRRRGLLWIAMFISLSWVASYATLRGVACRAQWLACPHAANDRTLLQRLPVSTGMLASAEKWQGPFDWTTIALVTLVPFGVAIRVPGTRNLGFAAIAAR